MLKRRGFKRLLLLASVVWMMSSHFSYASSFVVFGPSQTKMDGSIKYSVIGRYQANFNKFKGRVELNQKQDAIEAVYLEIQTDSIESSCKWCDKIVRSDQLLSVSKYPTITFKSDLIIKDNSGYTVKGLLDLHGVKKQVSFPFQAKITDMKDSSQKILDIKGEWQINRKDFKIVWNPFLDQGGVLVGNYITVNWGIKAGIEN